MSDAPERIWMPAGWEVLDGTIPVDGQAEDDDLEYVRTDLIPDPMDDPRVKALVGRVQKLRQIMSDNLIEQDGPQTVTLNDGTTHTGPVVDFLHQLVRLQIRALDHALEEMKGGE